MIIRHCGIKKKSKFSTELIQSNAHARALQHAHATKKHETDVSHRVHQNQRIGNGGVAFKPSRPREKTSFAFATHSRWNGTCFLFLE